MPETENDYCQGGEEMQTVDVAYRLVPFKVTCTYGHALGPDTVTTVGASWTSLIAWLLVLAVVVGHGMRRRERPFARGLVLGAFALGLFGVGAAEFGWQGGFGVTLVYGWVPTILLNWWLWPSRALSVISSGILAPLAVLAAWFVPGLMGWEVVAAVIALGAAAVAALLGDKSEKCFGPPLRHFERLT